MARAAHYETERGIDDFTFPCLFARRAKAYKETFDATDADIARVVVKAYSNGNRNPHAHMRAVTMSLEQAQNASENNPYFLANETYREHLKVSDCSQVSDGGSALVLATEAGLARLGVKAADCIELVGYGQVTAPLGRIEDITELSTTKRAAEQAYASARITARELQLAEVHDCFAVTELLMMEALGLSAKGKARDLVNAGATALSGPIPINPGGGLVAFGHPVGATGVKQVVEIFKQMLGRAGDYQVGSRPTTAVTANMGGDDRTAVVMVFRKS